MLMSSEKEFSIIPQKWGIKYSIQLTFIECLLWACCWVRLINISWTRLILGKMKSWLLLFVQSSFPPSYTGWILLPERFRHWTNLCTNKFVHVRGCTSLCCIVSTSALASYSSVTFTRFSLVFVTSSFVSFFSSTHAYGLGVLFFLGSSFLAPVASARFPSFVPWCGHLADRHGTPLMFT